jgi:hypothetical protein
VKRFVWLVLSIAMTGVACVGSSTPGSASTPGEPAPASVPVAVPVARAIRDGVIVELRLESGQVAAGRALLARVSVSNVAPGSVFWRGGGCDLLQDLTLTGPPLAATAPVPNPPLGDDPAAVAALVRWASGVGEIAHETFRPPDLPPGMAFACTSDLRINELAPGAAEVIQATWPGTTTDTLPAPAGRYLARVSFPFLARLHARPFLGDPFTDKDPIVAELGFEVVGPAWAGLSARDAIDAALADMQVADWIAQDLPRQRVGGVRIRLVDGTAWRIEIDLSDPSGDTEGVAVILVDARSGSVEIADPGS